MQLQKIMGLFLVRFFALSVVSLLVSAGQMKVQAPYTKGDMIYENDFSSGVNLQNWVMEGPGKIEFQDNWMHMYSPDESFHHVFWCPKDIPENFIAEWDMQNANPKGGLCIVFFAATGLHGEDIFDPSLPKRDGKFSRYTTDSLRSYHISYYANNPNEPARENAHLRKNNMFVIVQEGEEGIPRQSTAVHHITLMKHGGHILMYIDDRKLIDWKDDGATYGSVYGGGKIGFRQMRWSHFRYKNFKVWSLKN